MASSVTSTSLDPAFCTALGIEAVLHRWAGGQKDVFKIKRNGMVCVMKTFKNFSEREEREIAFYKKYANHPGIPKVLHQEAYGKDVVVFEEFIEGETLEDAAPKFVGNWSMVRGLIANIIDILEPFWNDDITHRDLKPRNIIVKQDGTPVIIDFGIARDGNASSLTHTGFMPRTMCFCAPEQHEGLKDQISYRTDYFNLGIIAHYLYFANLPFGASDSEVAAHFNTKRLVLSIADGNPIKPFCAATLQFSPAQRVRNCELLRESLLQEP